MIEERRTINSQFDNQLENFATENDFNAVPEIGAIVFTDLIGKNGTTFIGTGDEWLPLATLYDFSSVYEIIIDTKYFNGNPFNFDDGSFHLPNDGEDIISGGLDLYYDNALYFQPNQMYTLTISFTAMVTANNQHADLYILDTQLEQIINGCSDTISFVKGNGVYHDFTRTFQVRGTETTQNYGARIYLDASHEGSIYGVRYTIQSVSATQIETP